MFWGELILEGEANLMASEKSSRPCSCFRTTFSSRPNPSRNEDTASFLGHIPGVSELNESTLNLDDFFCASSTKVWKKQLGLRRIELNLLDFWKWWCSLTWRRYKLTTPFHQTKCPTQLRSAHNYIICYECRRRALNSLFFAFKKLPVFKFIPGGTVLIGTLMSSFPKRYVHLPTSKRGYETLGGSPWVVRKNHRRLAH